VYKRQGYNGAVPSFGSLDAQLLIIGLAPGVNGANRTGRPFTGDYAGDLLYPTLLKFGWAKGNYGAHANDGFTLIKARITNAVRCVPPANKPTPMEEKTCLSFLQQEITAMPNLRAVLVLGRTAHQSALKAFGKKLKDYPFAHGACLALTPRVTLYASYHCSRYNTSTKRLTTAMFETVVRSIPRGE
jgi:uracil-DNA glycosylase family 4